MLGRTPFGPTYALQEFQQEQAFECVYKSIHV